MPKTTLLAVLLVLSLSAHAANDPRVEAILREVPLIDGHNDLPWQVRERTGNRLARIDLLRDQSGGGEPLHTDIPRLRSGLVGAQFWSVWVPVSLQGAEAVQTTLEQIDAVHRIAAAYPGTFEIALTAGDIRRIHAAGKIASLIGAEGGHSINDSLAMLRTLHRAGVRYMTLTHSANVAWADASTDEPKHDGLTPFGRAVVGEMNRLGMLVDLSHTSPATMNDALDATLAPVIFSHSSARHLTDHPRGVPDDVLRRLPANGGLVMVTFVPPFVSEKNRLWYADRAAVEARFRELNEGNPQKARAELDAWVAANPAPRATLADVADHVEHVIRVAGEDHVGIGSDFDGISSTPAGLDSVADFPALFSELLRRGHSESRLKKLAGLNFLRVLERAEAVAARLQAERPASDALIGDVDGQALPAATPAR